MDKVKDILDMLDWNNSDEVQSRGIAMAQQLEDFSLLIRPVTKRHNKNVWDNCALIVCSKSDELLCPYAYRLLEWIQDLNWPGALAVLDRLKCVQSGAEFLRAIDSAIEYAENQNDVIWKYVLSMLLENAFLVQNLGAQTIAKLNEYQKIDLDADW